MENIVVVGAGTMGHGIAQVCAMANYKVWLVEPHAERLAAGLDRIRANLDKGVRLQKLTAQARDDALAHIHGAEQLPEPASAADMIIEAIPEQLEAKQTLFASVQAMTPSHCVYATNTSSLSVAAIAAHLDDPGKVIGTHFFNPVHRMPLLEVVVADTTHQCVVGRVQRFGERIGKELVVVRDTPGFATSRLGVCLGMEAIRMVEQGVASPKDIDKAMVLGYRHPMGPLRLTDLVGLDVRMNIGKYLANKLNNPAFEPPKLMQEMVAKGTLGQKTGQGFYSWES